ncbi:hypothetical protein RRG08_023373 [Elysia crispata]|uniref:Uncharacterized protein n=1 Tax=Elysia crispata TaxID=231223 RepID=A0AAE1BCM0_9GAST|nr:hypothetical protein RRG08_023373 [Elysia crispata]
MHFTVHKSRVYCNLQDGMADSKVWTAACGRLVAAMTVPYGAAQCKIVCFVYTERGAAVDKRSHTTGKLIQNLGACKETSPCSDGRRQLKA